MIIYPSRTPSALAAMLALLLMCGVAHGAPAVNKASGGGTIDVAGVLNTIAFTAHIDAAGVVKGQAQFQLRSQGLRLHVVVDCLSVLGNEAWIGGIVLTSSDPTLIGTRVTWRVQDNGEGGGVLDQGALPVPGVAGDCLQQPALPLLPWTNGNVQVK